MTFKKKKNDFSKLLGNLFDSNWTNNVDQGIITKQYSKFDFKFHLIHIFFVCF